jgi:predicted DNA-binding transcriptional regulator YafY
MRADRLVAVLMLLQTRGQVTAQEVAAELEISERTARRDLEALAMAGLPVFSVQGRNGGWRLAGNARTDLTGLTAAETRALFLVAGPSAASPGVKAALRKLVGALPEPLRADAEAASRAIMIDRSGWDSLVAERPPPAHLDAVQDAVVAGRQVVLGYADRTGTTTTRTIHPLGLVSKHPHWYLVAGTDAGQRTFRVDRVVTVTPTDDPVVRPDGFDLDEVWRSVLDELDRRRAPLRALAVVEPEWVGAVRDILGNRVGIGPHAPDGRVELELRGHTARSLAADLACLGDAIEVLEPDAVRTELARIGRELTSLYDA